MTPDQGAPRSVVRSRVAECLRPVATRLGMRAVVLSIKLIGLRR